MNRETRDKFASGTKRAALTSGNACWETPPAVFEKLNRDFGPFDVDLTADAKRALCGVWLGPSSTWAIDALAGAWQRFGSRGYSNPPYGPFVQQMLLTAYLEALCGDFATTLLLPMRVTEAFRKWVLRGAAELLFCDKRITFWENGAPRINPRTGKPDSALFDSIVVRYVPGHEGPPEVGEWAVPVHVPSARVVSVPLLGAAECAAR